MENKMFFDFQQLIIEVFFESSQSIKIRSPNVLFEIAFSWKNKFENFHLYNFKTKIYKKTNKKEIKIFRLMSLMTLKIKVIYKN